MPRDLPHRAAFASHGETYTRLLAEKNDDVGHQARAWLGELEAKRAEASALIRDKREAETLSIAKQANSIASDAYKATVEQARWAKWAVIISVVAAIIATASLIQSNL